MSWFYECTDGALRKRRYCHIVWDSTGRYWYVVGGEKDDSKRRARG